MPRDLPVGNGQFLVNFDSSYNVRDIYWPHVGQELHTHGEVCRTGIRVDGQFAWLNAPEWQREVGYEDDTLVTQVTLVHPELQLKLLFRDTVDFHRPVFLRHVTVTNLAGRPRDIRLFFHYDWYIWNDVDSNTVFYHPDSQSLVAYKGSAYFLASGQIGNGSDARTGISAWAAGVKKFNGAEGTWRDAEDGELGRNGIAQGSVDGTLALYLATVDSLASVEAYHWLVAGATLDAVLGLHKRIVTHNPLSYIERTRNFWRGWITKDAVHFADLSPELIRLYKRSLLILRTQIDNDGAIIAANDADVLNFSRDSYTYMWPRDGALVSLALNHAGYSEITRSFYQFCNAVLTNEGYLLHKYNPDRSWGSSWHPWIDRAGQPQLPIQEDETALVLYSLWHHYERFHDYEFVASLYRSLITPAADFLVRYRDTTTNLPDTSYDLWEERRGILSYTVSAVYAGLQAAAHFSKLFGEDALVQKYQQAAAEMKEATLRYLWNEERGHFLRMIIVEPSGSITRDTSLDSSLCGLFQFGMFDARDPYIERTMQKLEQTLWVKTPIGGMARYENDYYHQVTQDLSQAQGNPWFICTLWLAQYRIARARTAEELRQALPLLDWVRAHTLSSGVMAEQIHPFTGEPLSVSPLTWSHAEFVMTVRQYLKRMSEISQV